MKRSAMLAKDALSLLREGNARFVSAITSGAHRTPERRFTTAELGQDPFAAIVSCADSRVPLTMIFDRGIGDIFGLRIAGNVCSTELIGSIEYAVLELGPPLVVVLGHSKCGAVTTVVEGAHVDGNLVPLFQQISPAVDRVRTEHSYFSRGDLLSAAIRENIWFQIETLLTRSRHVAVAVARGGLEVVGAHYDIEHGDVTWYGSHPKQHTLLATQ